VRCGLALLELKQQVGHGKWLDFFAEHLETQGICLRHAQRYMEIGEAFKVKAARLGHARGTLAAKADEQPDLVRDILAEFTDATTWNQLWLDFGLMRKPKPAGGAREPDPDAPPPQTEAEVYGAHWQTLINSLHTECFNRRTHAYLPHVQIREIIGLLGDVREALKECLP
jgi:hypothetical protein